MSAQLLKDRVAKAWGDRATEDWLQALVEECERTSQRAAAKRLGVSDTVVTRVLGNSYAGDTEGIAEKVRGALLSVTVMCPVLEEIGRDRCIAEQGKKLSFGNALSARVYRACRGGCPHSRLGDGK
ncbi:MAG: transposase family protein [Parvibaculaceae bacterium]|nr:transposase family protein [Parvibaculaceae bacterium]